MRPTDGWRGKRVLTCGASAGEKDGASPGAELNDTVMRSSTSLLDNANLITKTVFPAEVAPVSVFLSSLISHGMALVLVVATIAVKEGRIGPLVLVLPVYMVLLGLFSIGIGWIERGPVKVAAIRARKSRAGGIHSPGPAERLTRGRSGPRRNAGTVPGRPPAIRKTGGIDRHPGGPLDLKFRPVRPSTTTRPPVMYSQP